MLRVATWNIAHRAPRADGRLAAEAFLTDVVAPDVALLQEAAPRPEVWPQLVAPHPVISDGRRWASAVASWGPTLELVTEAKPRSAAKPVSLLKTWPGTVAIAQAEVDSGAPLLFVSLYGLIDDGYTYATLHKQLSDLIYLFDSSLGSRVILGGDFNAGTQGSSRWRELYDNLWERMAMYGLVDLLEQTRERRDPLAGCTCDLENRCGHVHTVKLRSGKPVQTDYLFATRELAERLVSCDVLDGSNGGQDPFDISDHRPIVAAFDIPVRARSSAERRRPTAAAPRPARASGASAHKQPAPRTAHVPAVTASTTTGPAPAAFEASAPSNGDLAALATRLATLDADGSEPRITDLRLLVHVAAGRLKANWHYLKGGTEIRRRGFRPALVWAAAHLAVERGDITPRHSLVRTALERCELSSLDDGYAKYSDEARDICRKKLSQLEPSAGRHGSVR